MIGVLEQPALRGRSVCGAVLPAPAPAGAAPGCDDGARAGEDSAPVPISPAPAPPAPVSSAPEVPPSPGTGDLPAPHRAHPAEPVRVGAAGRTRRVPGEVPDA